MTLRPEQTNDSELLRVQLLVEGNDQRNFFEALTKFLRIKNTVQIRNFGGTDQFHDYLLGFKNEPGFNKIQRIGVIRDAESNFEGAFMSVCNSFRSVKLPVPEYHGTFTNSLPSVGVMILPGENQSGMLETLLCKTVSDCKINACIDKFFECIKNEVGIHVKRTEKARARVFIATQPEPHVSVGVAAKKGYWDLNHDEFTGIRNFLLELANLDSH